MKKRDIIVHAHIFKNAGSSFDSALKELFMEQFVDHRDDQQIVRGKEEYLINFLDQHQNIQAFSSHSIHFYPKNNEKYNLYPVYFVRHPIDRIRSVYSFEKKQVPANTKGSKKAKELNMNDYISWYMKDDSPFTIRNSQTIFLSGLGPGVANMDKKYIKALVNLKNIFLLGIVDRYDKSMVVFEEYLKNIFPSIDLSYIRRNITDTDTQSTVDEKAQKLLSQLDEKLQKEVLQKNEYDLKLYSKANELLDQKIADIDNFEQKLQNFEDRCLVKQIRLKEKSREFQEIVDILESVVNDKQTTNIHLYLAYAKSKKELGKHEEALLAYETIIKMFPNNPWAYFHQMEVYYLSNNKEKVTELYSKHKNIFKKHINIMRYIKNLGEFK